MFESEKFQQALEMFTKAIELCGSNPEFYCNRSDVHMKMENHLLSIEDCQKALDLDPDYSKAYNLIGEAQSMLMKFKEAVNMHTAAIEIDGFNPKFYLRHNIFQLELTYFPLF